MDNNFEEIFSTFEGKSNELIQLLQKVQEKFGFLSKDAIDEISKFISVPKSHIYAVATFYAQFRFKPIGKYLIKVCHGTACHVQNAQMITEILENTLDIKDGETTHDALFTLGSVACLGCCSLAPVMMISDESYGKLTSESCVKVITEIKNREKNQLAVANLDETFMTNKF